MKWSIIVVNSFIAIFLLCAAVWSAEDRINSLQKQISALERQKSQLDAEKQTLVNEGDDLSYKVDALKVQSKSGLGVIGRYKLSRALRKAQALSEKIQALEKNIYSLGGELKDKKGELVKEYERQIATLMEKLNNTKITSESKEILDKLKEYRAVKEQLAEKDKQEMEHLDIAKIDIEEYDGPKEIREKADLINDFANKLNNGIKSMNTRIGKLREERKTRMKLGEFAEEISFFSERVSREEIVADSGKQADKGTVEKTTLETAEQPEDKSTEPRKALENETFTTNVDTVTPTTPEPIQATGLPATTASGLPAATSKMVIERNGVYADFKGASLDQIEKEIRLLEKRKQELEKEKSKLAEKARSFYKKANEIEKSETRTGGKNK